MLKRTEAPSSTGAFQRELKGRAARLLGLFLGSPSRSANK